MAQTFVFICEQHSFASNPPVALCKLLLWDMQSVCSRSIHS